MLCFENYKSSDKSSSVMRFARAGIWLLVASISAAGCSNVSTEKPKEILDPNPYPANYRSQIVTLLTTTLTDRADFERALIAPPVLKPVPQSDIQHYVVCLQFNGRNVRKDKVVIYLAGKPNEYLDPTPEECGDAAYQPFNELVAAKPER
jgi:hypothetical protein